ncbi:MerR family transcriptional regulator [Paracoccus sp. (in: a-proteobacteria)]
MKSPQAFRSIGEVAQMIGVATHVLRYWETQFPALAPVRRPDGRRYYRPEDVQLAAGLCVVMREEGLTIRGARRLIALDRGEGLRARGRERLAMADPAGPDTATPATEPRARKPASPGKPARKTTRSVEGAPAERAGPSLPLFPELDPAAAARSAAQQSPPAAPQLLQDRGAWLARLTATAGALRRHADPPPPELARLRQDLGRALHRARGGSL